MKNRELANAVEEWLVCAKACVEKDTVENMQRAKEAGNKLQSIIASESSMEDITEIFSDLRDYWDTLEVGK